MDDAIPDRDLLFIPVTRDEFVRLVDQAAEPCPSLRAIADAFTHNILAVSSMCSVPFLMGAVLVQDRRLHLLTLAHQIREGAPWADASEQDRIEREAVAAASQRVESEGLPPTEAVLRSAAPIADAFRDGIEELLREGLVLAWSALEVLVTDLVREVLNRKPECVEKIMADPVCRRWFDLRAVPITLLQDHSFNLATSMGDVVLDQRRLDGFPAMKAILTALFADEHDIATVLRNDGLHVLSQRRNIIVHRRGVVDAEFMRKVPAAGPVGSRIRTSAADVDAALILVRDVGAVLIAAAGSLLEGGGNTAEAGAAG
jgi:hypothetical protein